MVRTFSLGITALATLALFGNAWAYYHAAPRATPAPASAGAVVKVAASEFSFEPRRITVEAGRVTFRLSNVGRAPHNLTIEELGKKTPVIPPGEAANLSVTLQKGTYTIYCAVQGHRERGMEGALVVRVEG